MLKCEDCNYEFEQNDIYYDTGYGILCEDCIGGYLYDLRCEFEREYDPNGEYEDFLLDQERGK